jgi:predicted RNase H-like HicB family nuclease
MPCAVVIEKANGNCSAYVPDLPGCVATGDTVAAVDGIAVPQQTSIAEYVET